jgi:hypothetical protein
VAEDKKSEEHFVMDDRAMEFLEQKLLKLYETLPRKDRIDLKENGTVAVGAVREKGKKPRLEKPMYVYTTASNGGSVAFHNAAKSLDLIWWDGDAGVTKRIPYPYSPPRLHPPNSPPPPDKGGIEHAEQLMIGYAEDYAVIDGMAVSRYLCEDCQDVITGYNNGYMKISVMLDPDKTLPKQRSLNWKRKQAKAAQEAAQKETGGEPAEAKPIPPPDPENDKRLKKLVYDRCAEAVKNAENPKLWKELLIQARSAASDIKDETMRTIADNTILNAENKILGR